MCCSPEKVTNYMGNALANEIKQQLGATAVDYAGTLQL